MVPRTRSSRNGQRLRALDPELPFLATEAAIDLHKLLSGQGKEKSNIRELGKKLESSIPPKSSDGTRRSLMDPPMLSVIGQAVANAAKNQSSQQIEDLLNEAEDIARALASDKLKTDREELIRLRDFCIALSNAVVAYRKSVRDLRPPHPYRR